MPDSDLRKHRHCFARELHCLGVSGIRGDSSINLMVNGLSMWSTVLVVKLRWIVERVIRGAGYCYRSSWLVLEGIVRIQIRSSELNCGAG